MNYAAIWHEATQRCCFCMEPGKFVFRLQVAKGDMKQVILHYRDKYLPLHIRDTRRSVPMTWVAGDSFRDYYEAELEFKVVCLRYCFELVDREGNRVFYSNSGFTKEIPEDIERLFDCPQTLREEECFRTPKWAEHGVIYQIFPSRFATDLDVDEKIWYQAPVDPHAELGGNLRGIIRKLGYIRDLGVDVLYMTPIFWSKSSHKYDTIDYYTIDPTFGTEEDLIELVEKAHELGLRVILDGVFNHTSPEFFAFRDMEEKQEKSAYKDWYYVEQFPLNRQPGQQNYKCFGYFWGMPKVNLTCPAAAEYFTNVALYWLRKANIDGWRLDVADEIGHSFWRNFRRAIKREFPEALIVGEVWHHAPNFLQGDTWDSVMNYPFYRSTLDFAAEGSCTASEYLGNMGFLRGNLHNAAHPLLWNLIGSHDTPRILYLCGQNKDRQKLMAALQLLQSGMPMIYYGDEVAMTGAKDPDCRRGMLWDENRQDKDMRRWYQNLIRVRKAYPAITKGQICFQEGMDSEGIIRITRQLEDQQVTIVFHNQPGETVMEDLAGKCNVLTGETFDGCVRGIGAWVLV